MTHIDVYEMLLVDVADIYNNVDFDCIKTMFLQTQQLALNYIWWIRNRIDSTKQRKNGIKILFIDRLQIRWCKCYCCGGTSERTSDSENIAQVCRLNPFLHMHQTMHDYIKKTKIKATQRKLLWRVTFSSNYSIAAMGSGFSS